MPLLGAKIKHITFCIFYRHVILKTFIKGNMSYKQVLHYYNAQQLLFLQMDIMILHFNKAICQVSSSQPLLSSSYSTDFLWCKGSKFSQIDFKNCRRGGNIFCISIYFQCSSDIRTHCHPSETICETSLLKTDLVLLLEKEVKFCLLCLTNCKYCQ